MIEFGQAIGGLMIAIFGGMTGVFLREFGERGYRERRRITIRILVAAAIGFLVCYGLLLIESGLAVKYPFIQFYLCALLIGILVSTGKQNSTQKD